jgi:ribosomal protein S18 acetylase RimI-like enzyme
MLTIRDSFEDGELPVLYQIEVECFTKEFRWMETVFKRAMVSARKNGFVWVAYISGRVAGYLLAGEVSSGKVSIETVNIAKVHRRKGIASKLIAVCERDMKKRGYKEVKLEVHVDNPAQLLYWNLGYRVNGFKRNYYKIREHAVSMAKKL